MERVEKSEASALLDCSLDNLDILRCLLHYGADANEIDLRDVQSRDLLILLLEFGYDVAKTGHTILQDFAGDRQVLDLLLDHGVDVKKIETARTADGLALYPGGYDNSIKILNGSAANADVELFDHLVSRGAEPARSLALHYTSKCKVPESAVTILSHLLDVYDMDIHADTDDLRNFFHDSPDSGTPLCSAIYYKNLAVVEALLKRGADPDRCGATGHLPTSKAMGDALFEGFLPALAPLLDAGADPTLALRHAVKRGNVDCAKVCLGYGADVKAGLQIAHEREVKRLREWANMPADIVDDEAPRYEAQRERNIAMIDFLASWKGDQRVNHFARRLRTRFYSFDHDHAALPK
ncbi:hypothetical protein CB0940_09973 [Cercospora beticola]|nr:hypothetical protein CB0940_09973 [Cercospora beticola]PIA92164.1 hypothetical protein CB0940_09973 [Cercospora beticola]